jgi:hypothetical protein
VKGVLTGKGGAASVLDNDVIAADSAIGIHGNCGGDIRNGDTELQFLYAKRPPFTHRKKFVVCIV